MQKNISYKRKTKAAFTLLEFIMSMAIFAMMMIVSADVIIRLVKTGEKSDARAEVNRNVEYVAETIKRTIRQAPPNAIANCANNSCEISLGNTNYKFTTAEYDKEGQRMKKIVQTINGETSDLTNENINIDMLRFNNVGGYLEITVKAYDTRKIVYKDGQPYTIITGALVKI